MYLEWQKTASKDRTSSEMFVQLSVLYNVFPSVSRYNFDTEYIQNELNNFFGEANENSTKRFTNMTVLKSKVKVFAKLT